MRRIGLAVVLAVGLAFASLAEAVLVRAGEIIQ